MIIHYLMPVIILAIIDVALLAAILYLVKHAPKKADKVSCEPAPEQDSENESKEEKPPFFERVSAFIQTNSGTIIKIMIHQLGLTVFGFLLYSASASSNNTAVILALSIFSAIFYLALLYFMSWGNGAKDKIRIDGGRMKRDSFKGAKCALVANIPNLILATLSLIGFLFIDKSALSAQGNYMHPEWAINLHGIAQIIGIFLNSMYTGIADIINVDTQPFYLFIVCIPSIIVCGLGYYFGTFEKYGVFTSAPKETKNK